MGSSGTGMSQMGMTGSEFGSRNAFVLPGGTVAVRSISSRSVLAPTQPSAFTFSCLAWKILTACSVCGPPAAVGGDVLAADLDAFAGNQQGVL